MKTIVIGLGNPILGDDGVGWVVAEEISKLKSCESTEVRVDYLSVGGRDYARKMILKERSSRDTPVRKVMTDHVITVDQSTTIEVCMDLMTYRRIRHLPVIENNRLIGVVSIGDILKAVILGQVSLMEYRKNRVFA